jgi:hypothetical protein
MVRTQIQLTDAQARRVRRLAKERGVSMAEVIRTCLDQVLESSEPDRSALYERAEAIVGQFEDQCDTRDLARRHDDYLATSFE